MGLKALSSKRTANSEQKLKIYTGTQPFNVFCFIIKSIHYLDNNLLLMKKFLLPFFCTVVLLNPVFSQKGFPVDDISGKVVFKKTTTVFLPRAEMYKRTKNWFLYQYATSKFENYFKISRNGKPVYLAEDKNMRSISGNYGFYIMYPVDDRSGLNMEQTFVLYTLTVNFKDSSFESKISNLKCFNTATSKKGMRPPEYNLETFNERQLNQLDYVQQYIIPQVTNSVRKIHDDLYRNIRYGNLTSE